jgi:hypothetical protein
VNRFAIGYTPNIEEMDYPVAVFVETGDGVLFQQRGEPDVQLLDREVGPVLGGPGQQVRPGEARYFDVVLDSFSTRFFIRTVTELEPDMIASMLLAETNWDLLPRPHAPQVAAA